MNEMLKPATRRTVLQRCLVFVAGALGAPLVTPEARGEPAASGPPAPPAPPQPSAAPELKGATTVRLYARRLKVHCPSKTPGQLPAWTGRLHSHSDLLERPDGAKVGEFSATCFSPESPFGCAGNDRALELQTLRLANGTLFGIGAAGPTAEGDRAHAVLGGTGQFAGARGGYVIRQSPAGPGEECVEFLITLIS